MQPVQLRLFDELVKRHVVVWTIPWVVNCEDNGTKVLGVLSNFFVVQLSNRNNKQDNLIGNFK